MKLTIDVISDVICPWCYVGKRRLERAIVSSEGQHTIEVHWLPFQLNPAMPKEGISRREYRTTKFGSWERSLELDAKMVDAGLERQLAADTLDSDAGMNAIKEAEGLSRRHRVEGVPFFIINNAIRLSGAQPPDAFLDAFRLVAGLESM